MKQGTPSILVTNYTAETIMVEVSEERRYEINYAIVDGLGLAGMVVLHGTGTYVVGWIHPRGSRLATPLGVPLVVPSHKSIIIDYNTPILINPDEERRLIPPGRDKLIPGVGPFTPVIIPAGLFHPNTPQVTAMVGRMPRLILRPPKQVPSPMEVSD